MKSKKLTCMSPVILLFIFFLPESYAQDYDMKFGQIPMEELAMLTYERDTSASAVILGEFGDITFRYDESDNMFKINFERHTRIKILKVGGYDWADHEIRLYHSLNLKETVGRIRAATYNLEGEKIVKSKLNKNAVFVDQVSDNWRYVKFTMPDVKVGSVIEYTYIVESEYLVNFPEWRFQYSIPVAWSELNVKIPEYFDYKQIMSDYESVYISNHETGHDRISVSSKSKSSGVRNMEPTSFTTQNIDFSVNKYRHVARNIPAFSNEPMITTADNYISKIRFELQSVQFPRQKIEYFTTTWDAIANKLIDHEDFGHELIKEAFYMNDFIKELDSSVADPMERIEKIYDHIKNYMKWNGKYSIFVTSELRKAYNDQSGSIGDINLLLTLLLKKAGFKAYPVVLSTRSNGIINTHFPQLTQFNYVICMVVEDNNRYLLDASDKFCTFNLLPQKCLNGMGLYISEESTGWVELNPTSIYDYETNLTLDMTSDAGFSGKLQNTRKDYAAYYLRRAIDEENDSDEFVKKIQDSNPGLEIVEYNYSNLSDVDLPVNEDYTINIEDFAIVAGDMIYFNPMFFEHMQSNPFKLEDRKYPIDYSYPRCEKYTLSLKIPEDYDIVEMPAKETLSMRDGSATYLYDIQFNEGSLTLESELKINKSIFVFNEYAELKQFYTDIVKAQSQQVVLEKSVSLPEL